MTLNMPRFSLEQFFMAVLLTPESTEHSGYTERCFRAAVLTGKLWLCWHLKIPEKKTNKREKNSGFRGWKCCITGCRGIINGLRFLACLKLIFEFWGRFSPLCVCCFERRTWPSLRGWKEQEQEMWEGQKVWGFGVFAILGQELWAGQGFIPAPVLRLGSTPHSQGCSGDPWYLLEGAGPQIHPGKIQVACASLIPEGCGMGSLIQQQLGQDFWQSRNEPATNPRSQGCSEWSFSVAVKSTLV